MKFTKRHNYVKTIGGVVLHFSAITKFQDNTSKDFRVNEQTHTVKILNIGTCMSEQTM